MASAVSKKVPKKSTPHPFTLPFSQKRIETMTDEERRGPVSPRSLAPVPKTATTPHCRVCGYTPRAPKPGQPNFCVEQIIEHLDSKHPFHVLSNFTEASIIYAQTQGDDSRCEFHGGAK
jgi:hypothetical protein